MHRETLRKIIWVTIFAIAMGFMETAVVVYLREIYYPEGFVFPLKPIAPDIALTEILREAATLIMLIAMGIFNGRNKLERFGYFLYTFAIWDIVYYIFLKLLLDWPESLMTFDILFLIPVTWVGPVLCPVINALSMILLALLVSYFTDFNVKTHLNRREQLFIIGSAFVIIFSYVKDYSQFLLQKYTFWEIFDFSKWEELADYGMTYIPVHFDWWIYLLGEGILLVGIGLFFNRNRREINRMDSMENLNETT